MLNNTINQTSKFRAKNWVEITDNSRGTYNTVSQIRFENTMLKSSLCDCSDAYIVAKGTITIPNTGKVASPNNRNKEVVFGNCAQFTNCVNEIKRIHK